MTPQDKRLERQIDICALELHGARTPKESRAALDRLRLLIARRTPERVREIEREKGLREE